MRKIALFMALGMMSATAFSQDIIKLNVKGNDATSEYDIAKIQNIKFDGEKMIVNHLEGSDEFQLDEINRMDFDIVSGIDAVYEKETADGLHVAINHGVLKATQAEGEIALRIFTLDGKAVDAAKADAELTYSLESLPKGTYVILVNKKAIKFIR